MMHVDQTAVLSSAAQAEWRLQVFMLLVTGYELSINSHLNIITVNGFWGVQNEILHS